MAYSAKADFQKRFTDAKLIALTRGTGAINETNLNEAIATADSIIDSYLMSVCSTLPLNDPPAYIKNYSVIIAVKELQKSIQYKDIPEFVMKEYDAAIAHLKDIAKGNANIAIDETTETRVDKIEFEDTPVIFDRGSW